MKPKISVLTAVYNTAPFLKECLDSLCNQTMKEVQFVCVDDASTDGSGAILDEYAARDARFVVIHQPKNQGQAVARNIGLEHAEGEFIAILDSDDWYEPNSLQLAYEAISLHPQADVALFQLVYRYADGTKKYYANKACNNAISGQDAFKLSIASWQIHGLYLVRRQLHLRYPFDASSSTYSDDNTTHLHYLHARQVVFSEGVYNYRQNPQSVTQAVSLRRFDRLQADLSLKKILEEEVAAGSIADGQEILRLNEQQRWLHVIDCYWIYYQNRSLFSTEDKQYIFGLFKAILPTIDKKKITTGQKLKLGYYPFHSFRLFRLSETLYMGLKSLLYRHHL